MSQNLEALLQQDRPLIMGILNLTPDSFSDGVPGLTVDAAMTVARQLLRDGADILDVGGESTRPDADPVEADEEIQRVLPFLLRFRDEFPDVAVSLDTQKYDVAKAVLSEVPLQVLNDVSFFRDERFAGLIKAYDCHYILMHSRGTPKTMMELTEYDGGILAGVQNEVDERLELLQERDVSMDRIILDPGFGFAKTPVQCAELMEHLDAWQAYDMPLCFGVSRKRFLQRYTGPCGPLERDGISAQLAVKAVEKGFVLIRTHNPEVTQRWLKQAASVHEKGSLS